MFRPSDTVVRINSPVEGGIKKGTKAIVATIIDETYMTLEGHEGQYRQSSFKLDTVTRTKPTVSDLDSLTEALRVIDNWNRTHPTAMMIGVDPYPTQDGGMVVEVNGEGFNSPDTFYEYMSYYASKQDRKAALKRALTMMGAELEE